ncbi:MAG: hypothetical protein OXH63_20590 [Gemmatimonadetes bacterium]|nr:hypothetical protein [Gemmatimonadota bacterium]
MASDGTDGTTVDRERVADAPAAREPDRAVWAIRAPLTVGFAVGVAWRYTRMISELAAPAPRL